MKTSFKKLMRACVPSSTPGPDAGFYRTVEESDWLPQVNSSMLRVQRIILGSVYKYLLSVSGFEINRQICHLKISIATY